MAPFRPCITVCLLNVSGHIDSSTCAFLTIYLFYLFRKSSFLVLVLSMSIQTYSLCLQSGSRTPAIQKGINRTRLTTTVSLKGGGLYAKFYYFVWCAFQITLVPEAFLHLLVLPPEF